MPKKTAAPAGADLLPSRPIDAVGRLFSPEEAELSWRARWEGMPAYDMGDGHSVKSIVVHFRSEKDFKEFKEVLDGKAWFIHGGQGSMWYGPKEQDYKVPRDLLWKTEGNYPARYPVYVPSVGRWETPLTARALDVLGVPYKLVVEPAQAAHYASAVGEDKLLVLPEDYSEKNTGSIPARNWIWEHSLQAGAKRHWILDDNIRGFLRVYRNRRVAVSGSSIFRAVEDFTDRYSNVAFSGFNYMYFVDERSATGEPFTLNTRVYSMILVNNALPYRWRGRYNEDTDICLCALEDGWCTILFNSFLGDKVSTLTMKGGNAGIYAAEDDASLRKEFAESLKRQHPYVEVVKRYDRWHHEVDYSRFQPPKNKLIEISNPPAVPDPEYGMRLVETKGRRGRYPTKETMNGHAERGIADGAEDGAAGNGAQGDVRAGGQAGVRRGEGGGVQRRRSDPPSRAWSP